MAICKALECQPGDILEYKVQTAKNQGSCSVV